MDGTRRDEKETREEVGQEPDEKWQDKKGEAIEGQDMSPIELDWSRLTLKAAGTSPERTSLGRVL